ncbi:hypothetical protein BD779DRAFT_1482577 [Infundibulicybe gibba]|nr:hypothetical protein BD779DRAFT_1482577 [Infundibulicybe gibba]
MLTAGLQAARSRTGSDARPNISRPMPSLTRDVLPKYPYRSVRNMVVGWPSRVKVFQEVEMCWVGLRDRFGLGSNVPTFEAILSPKPGGYFTTYCQPLERALMGNPQQCQVFSSCKLSRADSSTIIWIDRGDWDVNLRNMTGSQGTPITSPSLTAPRIPPGLGNILAQASNNIEKLLPRLPRASLAHAARQSRCRPHRGLKCEPKGLPAACRSSLSTLGIGDWRFGHHRLMKILYGMNINLRGPNNALSGAVTPGYQEVAELLLEKMVLILGRTHDMGGIETVGPGRERVGWEW